MSEIQKLKLNLKALKPEEDAQKIEETPESSPIGVGNISENSQEEIQNSEAIAAKKESTASPKSFKISFSDIRKDAGESDSHEKKSEPVIKSEEKANNNKAQPQDAKDTKAEEKTLMPEISEQEDKKTETDKIPLENESKVKDVAHAQEGSKKEKKSGLSFLKGRKKGKNIKEKAENEDLENIVRENKKEEIHFDNYESHFKKESSNILNRFRQFKYTPKTRVGLIIGLISFTAIGISGLMIFFPEKHSPEIYKASILQIMNKEPFPEDTHSPLINNNLDRIKNQETEEQEIEEQETKNQAEDTENNKEISEIQKKQESKEKLRQHLLEKYSG